MNLNDAVAAWRRTPAPEIADAVEQLDRAARETFQAPRARTKDDMQAAWLALAAQASKDERTTGWLAAHLTDKLPVAADHFGLLRPDYALEKWAALLARLTALRPRLPDPRIAQALLQAVSDAPFGVITPRGPKQVYGALCAGLVAAGDVRAIAPLTALIDAPRAKTEMIRAYLSKELPRVIASLRELEAPKLSAAERARWLELAGGERPRAPARDAASGAALLGKVYEDPDDDDARRVYADWLQERGDPQGELIALQLGPPNDSTAKRCRALIRAHKDEWLGPLGLVLAGLEFERGFLARAELRHHAAAEDKVWRAAIKDERLATIRELRLGRANQLTYASFIQSPHARGLRVIEAPQPAFLDRLLEGKALPVIRLALNRRPKLALLKRMVENPALGDLRVLICREVGKDAELLGALLASGLLARLEEVIVPAYGGSLTPLRTAIEKIKKRYPKLTVTMTKATPYD